MEGLLFNILLIFIFLSTAVWLSILKSKKKFLALIPILLIVILFYNLLGIFVIQPIGAIPEGATIVYYRSGMNLPFISSADGILDKNGKGVSLLERGVILGKLANPIREREIFRIGYSETLYLWSTDGKEYNK